MTPLVSIIVPVYNVQPYLRQCMESLIGQTLRDIEIICVDDGSTDGCSVILAEYAVKDERIRVLTQANAGTSAARNAGLDAATAPLIMFCDSDDWYAPTMCEKMYAAMQNGADMAVCAVQEVHEKTWKQGAGDKYFRLPAMGEVAANDELLLRCDVCCWNKVYRREVIEQKNLRFPEGLRYEDEFFYACYTAHVQRICFVDEALYYYRRHEESYMGQAGRKKTETAIQRVKIANCIWQYHDQQGFLPERISFLSYRWLQLCMQAYRLASGEEELAVIKKEAIEFARQYVLPQEALPAAARQRLILLIQDKWERTTRRWRGLLRIVTKDKSSLTSCRMQTKWFLLGIPLWVKRKIDTEAL